MGVSFLNHLTGPFIQHLKPNVALQAKQSPTPRSILLLLSFHSTLAAPTESVGDGVGSPRVSSESANSRVACLDFSRFLNLWSFKRRVKVNFTDRLVTLTRASFIRPYSQPQPFDAQGGTSTSLVRDTHEKCERSSNPQEEMQKKRGPFYLDCAATAFCLN